MERIEAEPSTGPGEDTAVRMPGRGFPGILIQGDGFSVLRARVAEIVEVCRQGDADEARALGELILADLDQLLEG
jgi:hypothetical protein